MKTVSKELGTNFAQNHSLSTPQSPHGKMPPFSAGSAEMAANTWHLVFVDDCRRLTWTARASIFTGLAVHDGRRGKRQGRFGQVCSLKSWRGGDARNLYYYNITNYYYYSYKLRTHLTKYTSTIYKLTKFTNYTLQIKQITTLLTQHTKRLPRNATFGPTSKAETPGEIPTREVLSGGPHHQASSRIGTAAYGNRGAHKCG